jgi:hypothetical protein
MAASAPVAVLGAPAGPVGPAVVPPPLPAITPRNGPILAVSTRVFNDAADFAEQLPRLVFFEEKTHSAWKLLTSAGSERIQSMLVYSARSAAKQTAAGQPVAPLTAIQRVNIPSGVSLLDIALPGNFNEATGQFDVIHVYMELSDLHAYWNRFAESYVQEMHGVLRNLDVQRDAAIAVLKSMVYVHIEAGRSYIEFRIAAPRV